jgi:hypothetical protein
MAMDAVRRRPRVPRQLRAPILNFVRIAPTIIMRLSAAAVPSVVSCGSGQGRVAYSMVEDRFLKRLRKKARRGLRGWPIATVAFYGPNLSQATKVAVGIVPSENAEAEELRDWKVDSGDIRSDPDIAREMLEFIEEHQVKSVAITDGIIGCPHQEGIDYEGEWCPVCEFWHGRDRFTGQRVH